MADNIEFDIAGTPCEAVIGRASAATLTICRAAFPEDVGLVDLGAESYLGVPPGGHRRRDPGSPRSARRRSDGGRRGTRPAAADVRVARRHRARAAADDNQIAALNEKLLQAAERARSLLAINNAVVLNLTRDALFRAITDALRPVVHFDRSTIFLYDDARNLLRLVVA